MRVKRPALVQYAIDLNILIAVLIIVSFFPKVLKTIGIIVEPSTLTNVIIRILTVIILSVITYGFFKLYKWGFWLAIIYNVFFIVVAVFSLINQNDPAHLTQQFIPSSLLGLMIILPTKSYFNNKSSNKAGEALKKVKQDH